MFAPHSLVSWSVDARFEIAMRLLRRALRAEGLEVCCELDVTERLRRSIGISLNKSVVLWVDDPLRLLEASVMSPAGALFVPEPLLIADRGSHCRAVLRALPLSTLNELSPGLRRTITGLHERISSALDRAGRKESKPCAEPHRAPLPTEQSVVAVLSE